MTSLKKPKEGRTPVAKVKAWEDLYLATCEKKWLQEILEALKVKGANAPPGSPAFIKICDDVLRALKFRSEKWEIFMHFPDKREAHKYKKFEQFIYEFIISEIEIETPDEESPGYSQETRGQPPDS